MERVGRSGAGRWERGQWNHLEGSLEEECHYERQEIWCPRDEVGSPPILSTRACAVVTAASWGGRCWGSDAGSTRAKVSSLLRLQRPGGCHMFPSCLLTWSRSLMAPLLMASRCVLGPPGGDVLEDTPPPTPVPPLWSPSAAEPGLASVHWYNLTPGKTGFKGRKASFSEWLLGSEPPLHCPFGFSAWDPGVTGKVVLWNQMA